MPLLKTTSFLSAIGCLIAAIIFGVNKQALAFFGFLLAFIFLMCFHFFIQEVQELQKRVASIEDKLKITSETQKGDS